MDYYLDFLWVIFLQNLQKTTLYCLLEFAVQKYSISWPLGRNGVLGFFSIWAGLGDLGYLKS